MRIYEIKEAILDPNKAAEYTKEIDMPKALAIAQTHCSDALEIYMQTGKSLFKGFPGNSYWNDENHKFNNSFYATDSSQIERRSQNTNNIYTYFTSNISKAWKAFPPRNRSLICSSAVSYASGYGNVFCVFPENGTKIGVCSYHDMWESFGRANINSLGSFASFLNACMVNWLKSKQILDKNVRAHNYDENQLDKYIPEFLKQPISVLNGVEDYYYIQYRIADFKNITVGEYLEKVLDPTFNKFSLVTPNKIFAIPDETGEGRECWFSGRCVLANKTDLDDLINEGAFK